MGQPLRTYCGDDKQQTELGASIPILASQVLAKDFARRANTLGAIGVGRHLLIGSKVSLRALHATGGRHGRVDGAGRALLALHVVEVDAGARAAHRAAGGPGGAPAAAERHALGAREGPRRAELAPGVAKRVTVEIEGALGAPALPRLVIERARAAQLARALLQADGRDVAELERAGGAGLALLLGAGEGGGAGRALLAADGLAAAALDAATDGAGDAARAGLRAAWADGAVRAGRADVGVAGLVEGVVGAGGAHGGRAGQVQDAARAARAAGARARRAGETGGRARRARGAGGRVLDGGEGAQRAVGAAAGR